MEALFHFEFTCVAGSCSTVSAVTCDECLRLSPLCGWCTKEVNTMVPRDEAENNRKKAHRIAKKLHSQALVVLYAICKYKEETSLTDATVFFACQNFTDWVSISSRCDTLDSLLEKGCSRDQVQFPVSESQILLDRPLGKITDDANSTQISPQKMSLKLRPGIPLRVSEINNLEVGSYCQKNIKGDLCVCVFCIHRQCGDFSG